MTTGAKTGRPHLGERHVVTARVAIPVRDGIDVIAAEFNTDRSTVLGDLAAALVGRPDLARRILFDASVRCGSAEAALKDNGQEGLPLAM